MDLDFDRDKPEHLLQTKKKPVYPIKPFLREYLRSYGREIDIPVSYDRLLDYWESAPLYDNEGEETLWETLIYSPADWEKLSLDLTRIYAILKAAGDLTVMNHLYADRIDYCTFGNTRPFRIRIVNSLNLNADYYYIKRADASRVYGLELEHLLGPKRIFYLTCGQTLIEEHIVGIPGDVFIDKWLVSQRLSPVRLAKELVKFNERCFVRLLGDMRPYNFVFEISPDFEGTQVRIRAMDFDQQSYCGRKNFYLPQFFKENYPLVDYCLKHLNRTTSSQYQREEQALIHKRTELGRIRLDDLLECMCIDRLSTKEKIYDLRLELAEHYGDKEFLKCERMGELVKESLANISRNIGRSSLGIRTPRDLMIP